MKDIILGKGLILKLFTPKSFKTWKAKSWIVQSLSRLGDMELQKHVTFQNLGCQVLKKVYDFKSHNCVCQVLTNISKCVHVLEDQVMKDKILGKGLILKLFTPKSFKTWKAKSWIVQSLSRLGDMELQKHVTFQNLGCQVLKKVHDFISHNCVCQVLTNISKYVHVLEDQVMKDIIRGRGLMLKLFTPNSFQTWKAKSWIVHSLSRLGDMELQKHVTFQHLGCQVLKKVHDFISHNCVCQVLTNISKCGHVWRTKSWKTLLMLKVFTPKSFKTWKAKSWIVQSLSRLGDMELQKKNISKFGIPSLEIQFVSHFLYWTCIEN